MSLLETKGLTKKYRRITALNQLDLIIEEGMVFGFLGPNGSGKTTTLGLLLDVLKPTSGSFYWFGQPSSPALRQKIGAILEHPCFYPYLSGFQNLKIAAKIKNCSPENILKVLDTVGLLDRKDDSFKTYSLGMKQRLAIGSALIADPRVLILDEPTNGLDPQGIVEIRKLIQRIAQMGKTIILASHLLDEVQKVCSHFMVLSKGNKLFQGSVADALGTKTRIEVAAKDLFQLRSIVLESNMITEIETYPDHLILSMTEEIDALQLNQYLIQRGIILSHLVERSGNLEEEFLKILAEDD